MEIAIINGNLVGKATEIAHLNSLFRNDGQVIVEDVSIANYDFGIRASWLK